MKPKHKVRTQWNRQQDPGKVFTQASQTVPDQSIPLKTLLERHTRGLPLNASMRIPVFEEEGYESHGGIDIKTLDLVDIQQLTEQTRDNIAYYKAELNEKNEKSKQAAIAAAEEAKAKKIIEDHEKSKKTTENQ